MLKLNPSIHRCHCLSGVRPCQLAQGSKTARLSQTLPFFFTHSGLKFNNMDGNCMTQHGKERQENSCSSHSRTIWRIIHLGTDGTRRSWGSTWIPLGVFLYKASNGKSYCFACPITWKAAKVRGQVGAWCVITEADGCYSKCSQSSCILKIYLG